MNIIKPSPLKKNATIGFLSISGNITNTENLDKAKMYFESRGYNVKFSSNILLSYNSRCGTDKQRLEALHAFFLDDSVDAILCVRGGYGSIRIIKDIDYDLILKNPKIFAGYSDITALNLMFYKKSRLMTFSSPMAYPDFHDIDEYSEKSFFKALSYEQEFLPFYDSAVVLNKGKTQGRLWGGNLATVSSLCGLDFVPDEKFIFFAEDVSEPVYKIDRMMTQLMNIDKFRNNLAGIVLGDFGEIDNRDYFDSFWKEFSVPVKSGLLFGHIKKKLTLPVGAYCEFDTQKDYVKLIF